MNKYLLYATIMEVSSAEKWLGTYVPPTNSWNPQINGTLATGPDFGAQLSDLSNALTQSISADGQTPVVGNLNMNGNKLVNLAPGSAVGDSVRWGQLFSQGVEQDIASAATTDIGSQNTNFLRVTGTTTITSFGTAYNGPKFLRMAAALTITNSATLICPEGSDILTAANDILIVLPKATTGTADGWYVARWVKAGDYQGQRFSAFQTAGTAPAFTLTPSPAITSYSIYQRFNVNFNANGTLGSNTINISGLGAKSLKQYDGAGNKQSAQITSGLIADIIYDGTDFVLQSAFVTGLSKIQSISSSVAGNNLTINYAGGALDFRSATLTSGAVTATVVNPLTIVVPNGATLGTTNALSARLAILVAYNGGSPVLCVSNLSGGVNLDESNLISPTTISAGATSATIIYSASVVGGNSPYRVVGYIDITEATAGTWATAATAAQGAGGESFSALQSGGMGQTWQGFTIGTQRVYGTLYYNNTNKPIKVTWSSQNVQSSTYALFVNGTQIQIVNAGVVGTPVSGVLYGEVPPWQSYQITNTSGSAVGPIWSELR